MDHSNDGLAEGPDGRLRCAWCLGDDGYLVYHDTEWGFPVHDDRALFEKICLEGFQAGLSWLTILRKRDSFRAAFDQFDSRDRRGLRADATSSACSAMRASCATAARSRRRSTTPSDAASSWPQRGRWPPSCGSSAP